MTATTGFVIRDGLKRDIPTCLSLDHHYETDHVWQMQIQQSPTQWHIKFNTERLPRTLRTEYQPSKARLERALPTDQCFLIAALQNEPDILGYLTMYSQPVEKYGLIQDIVVSEPFRRRRIGTRLLAVARQWAQEHTLNQLFIEMQTQNYPAMLFCQALGFTFCGFNDQYLPNQDIAIFFGMTIR